jgi:phytoene dehydrogenase-like protein
LRGDAIAAVSDTAVVVTGKTLRAKGPDSDENRSVWTHGWIFNVWTPLDIRRQYYSNGGSIYGVVCDRFKNFAFKAPKQSERYANLYFVGGSVNPGGGMPMVVLCGQNVARQVAARDPTP